MDSGKARLKVMRGDKTKAPKTGDDCGKRPILNITSCKKIYVCLPHIVARDYG